MSNKQTYKTIINVSFKVHIYTFKDITAPLEGFTAHFKPFVAQLLTKNLRVTDLKLSYDLETQRKRAERANRRDCVGS